MKVIGGKRIMKGKKRIKQEYIILILKVIIIISILIFLVMRFVFASVHIDGTSMEPTLRNNEYGIANRFVVSEETITRFDIVVVDEADEGQIVKRVVGLPNETIQYKDDTLYINGQLVLEPFLDQDYIESHTMEHKIPFTSDFGPITLKKDEYFVLGDNRMNSKDSRAFGPIKIDSIIAKDIIILYPFDQIRIENSK